MQVEQVMRTRPIGIGTLSAVVAMLALAPSCIEQRGELNQGSSRHSHYRSEPNQS